MREVIFKVVVVLIIGGFIPGTLFSKTQERELFNEHKSNIRKGNTCYFCHEVSEIKDLAHISSWIDSHKTVAVRKEGECLKCHSRNFCADCHSFKQGLKPSEKNFDDVLPSYKHRGNWIARHPLEAKADSAKCYRCHTQQSCAKCHPKVSTPHPSGWLSQHGDEARRNIGSCAACHENGLDTVCIKCHRTRNPHPPGWSDDHPGLDKKKDRPCIYCHK